MATESALQKKYNESKIWQKHHQDYHAILAHIKTSSEFKEKEKKDFEKLIKKKINIFSPHNISSGFTTWPDSLMQIIYLNGHIFTGYRTHVLMCLIHMTVGFRKWTSHYNSAEVRKKVGLTRQTYKNVIDWLTKAGIIIIEDTTLRDKKESKIYTKQKITLNPFYDTWDVQAMCNSKQLHDGTTLNTNIVIDNCSIKKRFASVYMTEAELQDHTLEEGVGDAQEDLNDMLEEL